MGYYVDFVLAIDKAAFLEVTALRQVPLPEAFQGEDMCTKTITEDIVYFEYDGVFYTKLSDELDIFMDALDEMEKSMTKGTHTPEVYGFVLIGEDYNDVETRGDYGSYGLEIERSITIN